MSMSALPQTSQADPGGPSAAAWIERFSESEWFAHFAQGGSLPGGLSREAQLRASRAMETLMATRRLQIRAGAFPTGSNLPEE